MTSAHNGAGAVERPRFELPAAGQRRILRLAGLPRQVVLGRDFARTALTDWGWPGDEAVADLLLVVSELVANARLHAGGALQLGLHLSPSRLRIEVTDPAAAPPVLGLPHLPGLPGGHGLHIVRRLVDTWGVTPHEQGKTVWAEIRVPEPEAERPGG
ncbi:ATP-binding protein [Kitasatospora sp. NPDC094015]|uniref:ATP-binding protein n=1 Tax=Kitasatospora sp. NPDC094015 TaxID=3155205 RepID=UPI003327E097